MASRFPANEAPDPKTKEILVNRMDALHRGKLSAMEKNGVELAGWCATMNYIPPEVTDGFFNFANVAFHANHANPHNRELAVLGLLSTIDAPYMHEAHLAMGEQRKLFTEEQIRTALKGRIPEGLSREQQAAFRLGKDLADLRGPLEEEKWQGYSGKLSKSEIAGLINFVGVYKWLSLLVLVKG